MEIKTRAIAFSGELWELIDTCRGREGRAAWIERQLWVNEEIERAAFETGIRQPERNTWLHKPEKGEKPCSRKR